jgi:uncharacterized protein (TIGR02246 family)
MLTASAESWTRGDLEGFLDDYAADATYVGSSGLTRGVDEVRQAYLDGYWSTGMPEDGLRFRLLDVRPIGARTAVVIGRYILYDRDSGSATATGVFSLTLERRAGEWKIVHDHSSADPDDGG